MFLALSNVLSKLPTAKTNIWNLRAIFVSSFKFLYQSEMISYCSASILSIGTAKFSPSTTSNLHFFRPKADTILVFPEIDKAENYISQA